MFAANNRAHQRQKRIQIKHWCYQQAKIWCQQFDLDRFMQVHAIAKSTFRQSMGHFIRDYRDFSDEQDTLLHVAVKSLCDPYCFIDSDDDFFTLIDFLLQQGDDPTHADIAGKTPEMYLLEAFDENDATVSSYRDSVEAYHEPVTPRICYYP